MAGETCEAESLAALEAFQIVIQPRTGGKTAAKGSGSQNRENTATGTGS